MTSLRIDTLENGDGALVVRVEGWVAGETVDLLESAVRQRLRDSDCLELDLSGVPFVSPLAIEMLRRLCTAGVRIGRCSPLLQDILDGDVGGACGD